MQYYRCKCGKTFHFGSVGPKRCRGCSYCGTTLTQYPDDHKTPEPHEFVTKYNEDTGEPYEICRQCGYVRDA